MISAENEATLCYSYSYYTVLNALLPVMASIRDVSPTEQKKWAFVFEMESYIQHFPLSPQIQKKIPFYISFFIVLKTVPDVLQ